VSSFRAIGPAGRAGAASERVRSTVINKRETRGSRRCGGTRFRRELFAVPRRSDGSAAAHYRDGDHAHENAGETFTTGRTASLEVPCTLVSSPHLVALVFTYRALKGGRTLNEQTDEVGNTWRTLFFLFGQGDRR